MKPPHKWIVWGILPAAGLVLGWFLAPREDAPPAPESPTGGPDKPPPAIAALEKNASEGCLALLQNPRFSAAKVWTAWAGVDPAACHNALTRQPGWQQALPSPAPYHFRLDLAGRHLPEQFLQSLFSGWLVKDRDAALNAFERVPEHVDIRSAKGVLLVKILTNDPAQAAAFIRRHSAGANALQFDQVKWGGPNLDAWKVELAALPENEFCNSLLEHFARTFVKHNSGAALEWAAQLKRRNSQRIASILASQLASLPPGESMALLSDVQNGEFRRTVAAEFAPWAGKGAPQEAWAAASQHGLLDDMLPALFSSWAEKDPKAAFDFFATLEPPLQAKIRDVALFALGRKYPALAGPEAARLPDGPAKTRLLHQLAPDWTAADPEGAARHLETAPNPEKQALLTLLIYRTWAGKNPTGAAARAQTLPEPLRDVAILAAFKAWASRDKNAAVKAAEAIPDEKTRAAALFATAASGG